jgi:hypothetical protein
MIPTAVPAIIGRRGGDGEDNESESDETAERSSFESCHGGLLLGGANMRHSMGNHASTSQNETQRYRTVCYFLLQHQLSTYEVLPVARAAPAWRTRV